jgi:hypothetical protein
MIQPLSLANSPSVKLQRLYDKCTTSLQVNYSRFVQDQNFYWMTLFGRFEIVREWKTRKGTSAQSFEQVCDRSTSAQNLLTDDVAIATIADTLNQEGYYQGLRLSPQTLDALIQFANSHPCYANRNAQHPFYIHQQQQLTATLSEPLRLASYFGTHEDCAAFQRLKHDPVLLAIAERYLGCKPKYHRSEIAWSFPGDATETDKIQAAQVFHCDINDYKTLKFFFYLTDVTPDCGPHRYLAGTNHHRKLKHQLLGQRCAGIPDEVLLQTYGVDKLKTVCGSAGFGFVGDPYTFHKGTIPTQSPRLLLQLEFGVNQYKTWYFQT